MRIYRLSGTEKKVLKKLTRYAEPICFNPASSVADPDQRIRITDLQIPIWKLLISSVAFKIIFFQVFCLLFFLGTFNLNQSS